MHLDCHARRDMRLTEEGSAFRFLKGLARKAEEGHDYARSHRMAGCPRRIPGFRASQPESDIRRRLSNVRAIEGIPKHWCFLGQAWRAEIEHPNVQTES